MKQSDPLNDWRELFPVDDEDDDQDDPRPTVEPSSIAVGLRSARVRLEHRRAICAALNRRGYAREG